MLFSLECQSLLFQHHADIYVERFSSLCSLFIVFSVYSELRVVCVLHPTAFIFLVFFYIDTFLYESLIQFLHQVELTGQVNHRTSLAFLVNHEQRRNTCRTSHVRIVRTKCRCNVYDTRTVFCSDIITRDNTECFSRSFFPGTVFCSFHRFHPWDKLLVFHTNQVSTLVLAYHLERNQFITRLVVFQCNVFCFFIEMRIEQRFGKYHRHLFSIISIVSLNSYIVNLRAHTKCRI